MTTTWSPLLVIRPDAGEALLEDSHEGRAERVAPAELAREILSGSPRLAGAELADGQSLDPVLTDWVSNGWRPSLEYFGWSEHGASVPPPDGDHRPAPAGAVEASAEAARWTWGDEVAAPVDVTVGDVLMRRRTVRHYRPGTLPATAFAALLSGFAEFAAQPAEPSGAWSGLRLGAVVYSVEGLEPGVWDLDLGERTAVQRSGGDLRADLAELMCGMQAAMTASATLVLVVDFPERQRAFPYERGLRELYVEVGRIAQKFILVAEAQGIGALITPATNDHVLSRLLGLPESEAPVYTITFGPKPSPAAGAAR